MACSCKAGRVYVAIRPDGSRVSYSTSQEAAADVSRNGGSFIVQQKG